MALAEHGHGDPRRSMQRPAHARAKLPPVLGRFRASQKPPPVRVWPGLLAAVLLVTLLIPTLALAVASLLYVNTATTLQGRLDKLAIHTEQAFQTSRIFDRNGQLLYEFINEGRRDPVRLDQIAPVLRAATIAIEDKTFYENVGVDYAGIAKAAIRNFESGQEVSGASTITQQLIKNIILTQRERAYENRYRRKITEIILAQEINDQLSKDKILELYLNEIPYGNLAYGIEAAAHGYFGISAAELDLNQASLLAGLPQSPTVYNPIQYLQGGQVLKGVRLPKDWVDSDGGSLPGMTPPRARQVKVLRQMVLSGKVSERRARGAIGADLTFTSQSVAIHAPHFVFYVKQALENDPLVGRMLANEGGLSITTTLDLRIQRLAQTKAAERIAELKLEQRNIHNAAVVVMQPGSGQILGMVGSIDYNRTQETTTPGESGNVIDGNVNVTTRERQPGSSLKPFTYLSALEQGKLDPGSVIWDVDTRFPTGAASTRTDLADPKAWYAPTNYDQRWHGPLRMREALANSLNMPAVKALKQAGVGETIDLLHRAGIRGLDQSQDFYGLALTLGGGEVTPLDLTTAYNTLANNGEYVPSTPFLAITDRGGHRLPVQAEQRRQAVDPKYVAIIRDFMGDNDARTPIFGPNSPLNLSRPAHVKTGTTEDFRDAWAVGFTPYVTVGVWTGNNNNEKTARVESTVGGGVIWNRIMESLFRDPDLERLLRGPDLSVPIAFPSPAAFGLEERPICRAGSLGRRTTEWFVAVSGAPRSTEIDCDLQRTIKLVYEPGGACRPLPGIDYGARLITHRVANVPVSSEDEVVVDPQWAGVAAASQPTEPDHICPIAPPTPTPTQPAPPIAGLPPVIAPPLAALPPVAAPPIAALPPVVAPPPIAWSPPVVAPPAGWLPPPEPAPVIPQAPVAPAPQIVAAPILEPAPVVSQPEPVAPQPVVEPAPPVVTEPLPPSEPVPPPAEIVLPPAQEAPIDPGVNPPPPAEPVPPPPAEPAPLPPVESVAEVPPPLPEPAPLPPLEPLPLPPPPALP